MPSIVFSRWTATLCATACLAMPAAFAAELGEISVQSHVGQPLSADIELTALAPDELQGLPVRLASANVYEGGGISMDAALQTLAISQVERDGRRFVHLGYAAGDQCRPCACVSDAGQWQPRRGAAGHCLADAGAARASACTRSCAGAQSRGAASRRAGDCAQAVSRCRTPPPWRRAPAPKACCARRPCLSRHRWRRSRHSCRSSPPPLRRAAAPVAACAPQAAGMPAAACVALDRQNTALNEKIGVLEGKVSALQQALAAPAAAVPAAPAAAVAAACQGQGLRRRKRKPAAMACCGWAWAPCCSCW